MAAYFVSSVLLSLLLGDEHATEAMRLWHSELDRVSSTLLAVECTTVLRRSLSPTLRPEQREAAESRLRGALEEVTIKPVDEDIVVLVNGMPALAACRTLDVVHIATALFFRAAEPDLPIFTFDARMARVARDLGVVVRGAD